MTVDLRTRYLGLDLASPLVASAGPLTGEVATARRLADAGAGALVLPSLFEEEIVHDEIELGRALEAGAEHFAEALDYFPSVPHLHSVADRYLDRLARIQEAVDVPVIASLNATSAGGWTRHARLLADAGAAAVELNLYRVAADPDRTGAEVEDDDIATIAAVRDRLEVPLAVKLSPYYSSIANFARRASAAGSDGLVLFNRFYQPDIDLEALEVVPRVELSSPAELRLPLRWIAILRPQLGPDVSLAATSGITTGTDVAKALIAGADVAMTTSAVLRRGPEHLAQMTTELTSWLADHDYGSVSELRGAMTTASVPDPAAYERANYLATLRSWAAPHGLTPSSPPA